MSESEKGTLENIHTAAKKEFWGKRFKSASLRSIVKTAGVTTGAFYGYYKSKEELLDALVKEQYDVFMKMFTGAQDEFAKQAHENQRVNMGEYSGEQMMEMTKYAYDNIDAFKLLLCCSEGTRYENMVHDMVEIEVNATPCICKDDGKFGVAGIYCRPIP